MYQLFSHSSYDDWAMWPRATMEANYFRNHLCDELDDFFMDTKGIFSRRLYQPAVPVCITADHAIQTSPIATPCVQSTQTLPVPVSVPRSIQTYMTPNLSRSMQTSPVPFKVRATQTFITPVVKSVQTSPVTFKVCSTQTFIVPVVKSVQTSPVPYTVRSSQTFFTPIFKSAQTSPVRYMTGTTQTFLTPNTQSVQTSPIQATSVIIRSIQPVVAEPSARPLIFTSVPSFQFRTGGEHSLCQTFSMSPESSLVLPSAGLSQPEIYYSDPASGFNMSGLLEPASASPAATFMMLASSTSKRLAAAGSNIPSVHVLSVVMTAASAADAAAAPATTSPVAPSEVVIKQMNVADIGPVVRDAAGKRCVLGRGTFGEVYRVYQSRTTSAEYVCKELNDLSDHSDALQEARMQSFAAKTGCVPHVVGTATSGSRAYIYTQYMPDTYTLEMMLKYPSFRFGGPMYLQILINLARAIQKIHGLNVLHNDIKSNNFLVCADRSVYLIDFGLASHNGGRIFHGVDPADRNRYPHMAPELFYGETSTVKSDIFSLGHVIQTVCKKLGHIRMAGLGDSCCREDPTARPDLDYIIWELEYLLSIEGSEFFLPGD